MSAVTSQLPAQPEERRMKPHGHVTRYATGCRCDDCRAAHTERARFRRRMRAYGRWTPQGVSRVGTQRRVEALACLGWSMRALSRMCGWHEDRLSQLINNAEYEQVSPANRDRIARLYDELADRRPPTDTKEQRMSVSRAIGHARRSGFAPPIAWDDDIDDPNAQPYASAPVDIDEIAVEQACNGRRVHLTRTERLAAVATLTERGYSEKQISELLGYPARTVARDKAAIRGQDAA